MSERSIRLYLEDVLNSIAKIEEYVAGLSFEDFRGKAVIVDAVIRNFAIIGEAGRHIPDQMREQNSVVDWKNIVGMRDVVMHEYFGVDLEIVWRTIQKGLPKLKDVVEKMVADA